MRSFSDNSLSLVFGNASRLQFVSFVFHAPDNGIVRCATTLALMAERSPGDLVAKNALVAGLLHFNENVRLASVDGVSSVLVGKHEHLLGFCLWVLVDQTKQWNEINARNEKLEWNQRPSAAENWAAALAATRKAENAAWFTSSPSMDNLIFKSWPDRRLVRMLLRLHGSQLAQDFFATVAMALASWWALDRRTGSDKEAERDFKLTQLANQALAGFVLTSAPDKALQLVAPLLAGVGSHPEGVERFLVQMLLIELSGQGTSAYWQVWAVFADAIRKAPWQKELDSDYSDGRGAVSHSFLNCRWCAGTRNWARLGVRFEDVDIHFVTSPQSTYTLKCYVEYLYQIGAVSLPNALALITEKFGDQLSVAVETEVDLKFHLDALVSRVLFENLAEIRKTQRHRLAMMTILDALVQSGSSIAFQLRDDFVTPTVNGGIKK